MSSACYGAPFTADGSPMKTPVKEQKRMQKESPEEKKGAKVRRTAGETPAKTTMTLQKRMGESPEEKKAAKTRKTADEDPHDIPFFYAFSTVHMLVRWIVQQDKSRGSKLDAQEVRNRMPVYMKGNFKVEAARDNDGSTEKSGGGC